MSAIDLDMNLERRPSRLGDRGELTMSGKFLPHQRYLWATPPYMPGPHQLACSDPERGMDCQGASPEPSPNGLPLVNSPQP